VAEQLHGAFPISVEQGEQQKLPSPRQNIETGANQLARELPGGSWSQNPDSSHLHREYDLALKQWPQVTNQDFNFRQLWHRII
jgi:hypothetical protein